MQHPQDDLPGLLLGGLPASVLRDRPPVALTGPARSDRTVLRGTYA